MVRNVAREIAMHLSYELGFTGLTPDELLDQRLSDSHFQELAPEYEVYGKLPGPTQRSYIRRAVKGVAVHGYELDQYIEKYSVGWKFERIPLVAAAIMRLAMFEILYMPDVPNGAAINEALEIAKKYESPDTVRFINGVLGTFVRTETEIQPPKTVPGATAAEPAAKEA